MEMESHFVWTSWKSSQYAVLHVGFSYCSGRGIVEIVLFLGLLI